MKVFNNFYFLLSIFITLLINVAYVKGSSDGEEYYMVNVVHTFENTKSDEYKQFINGVIKNIHDLIVENKDTYNDKAKLDKLESDFNNGQYLVDYGESPFVYPISAVKNRTVLYAYLTSDLANQISYMPNVKSVVADSGVTYDHYNEKNNSNTSNNDNNSTNNDSSTNSGNSTSNDSSNINDSSSTNPTNIKCLSEKVGYPCCSSENKIVYHIDKNGEWGFDFEKNNWCGITTVDEIKKSSSGECWSQKFNYPCCSKCDIILKDNSGFWGIENNKWCGIVSDHCF